MTPELHQQVQDFYLHVMALTKFTFVVGKQAHFYNEVLKGEQPYINEQIFNLRKNDLTVKYDRGSTLYFVYHSANDTDTLITLPNLAGIQVELKLKQILTKYE
ncbi:hypothetical protein ACLBWM_14485 [Acinetobacter radioresistens]|uniref:hypothetical protein n=1 Tax=Acinetobacter radioresistens TaxID=40216 RepID=UPI0021CD3860|nr:hypothetical protein [Acinetobacter radioresistens]MCU4499971.1 hypothetical protein [Acinetobacter radioresistens]